MEQLNLAENIIQLRHEKQITQEQLAQFLGVTKASVSKWENRQSMPDILLLPKLAVFFDVSIDRLMGFQSQLSREQIQKLYQDLAGGFAQKPFAEAMEKSREQVRSYYSCYPFLLQICILWLNHYTLPQEKEVQQEVLKELETLCDHIIQNCSAVNICNDAIGIKAMAGIQLGKAAEAAETLEHITDPTRISGQSDLLLIQAYQMMGDIPKAKSYTQITMYSHLLSLLGSGIRYLAVELQNFKQCQETILRLEHLIELYKVNRLNPNITAQFYYQSALVYAFHQKKEQALAQLKQYANTLEILIETDQIKLHGDAYFDKLDAWLEKLALGAEPPRRMEMVLKSIQESLEHPLLVFLQDSQVFQKLREAWKTKKGEV